MAVAPARVSRATRFAVTNAGGVAGALVASAIDAHFARGVEAGAPGLSLLAADAGLLVPVGVLVGAAMAVTEAALFPPGVDAAWS